MARTARIKKPYSTYLIAQQCELSIFNKREVRILFIDVLRETIEKYNCLVLNCAIDDNSYRLLIYDNGNDISSIMRSINISFSMKTLNQSVKFCRRFKSTLLEDSAALFNQIATFEALPKVYRDRLIDANCNVDVSAFRKSYFKDNGLYCKLIDDFNHCLPLTDCCDNLKNQTSSVITAETAKVHIETLLNKRGVTFESLSCDKKMRNHCILYLRRNSTMTLKQIGNLFDLTESAVSKLIKRHCSIIGGNDGTIF